MIGARFVRISPVAMTSRNFTLSGVNEMEAEATLSSAWDQHLASEFGAKSADEAVATMTAESHVNVVSLMVGAKGRDNVRAFYANHFLNQIPPDMETVAVSRTIGQGRVVDEMIMRFTHSIKMDWLLPGIPPTGKRLEVPMVAIIQFEGDKIEHEHLYWDQASMLVQVGLLDRTLPVRGGEIAAQVLNPTQPMNELIYRGLDNNGQTLTNPNANRRTQCENPIGWSAPA
jgi:carboxymethylenebutenolidase